ncbi:MAG TPA: DUF2752 domain-containing protein [Planctomicrobium sp.]|nr:DUF2752 domain-containing protein [Planctomicrobium sp.]
MFISPREGVSLSGWQRGTLFLLGLTLFSGFLVAWWLTPDPRGFGTHQQFGLPPCSLELFFGIPCPGCGSTTSFALFVKGDWLRSLQANAAGFGLALGSSIFIPWSWLSSYLGRSWGISHPGRVLLWSLIGLNGIALIQWCDRLFAS